MYTKTLDNFFVFLIILTIIVGVIAGLLFGAAFMAPNPEDVANKIEYPTLYEDEVLENQWNATCTAVTGIIWLATALTATFLYCKALALRMQDEMLVLQRELSKENQQ